MVWATQCVSCSELENFSQCVFCTNFLALYFMMVFTVEKMWGRPSRSKLETKNTSFVILSSCRSCVLPNLIALFKLFKLYCVSQIFYCISLLISDLFEVSCICVRIILQVFLAYKSTLSFSLISTIGYPIKYYFNLITKQIIQYDNNFFKNINK